MKNEGRDSRTQAAPAWLVPCAGGYLIAVHVQPAARRSAVVGEHGGRLKLAVQAPPLEGRANEAVVELLAQRLGLARRALTLVAGESRRDKRVRIGTELPVGEVAARLTTSPK
ncbi:MAG: DUF167 domain-containing protein [Betaproteobacteria bacterium]